MPRDTNPEHWRLFFFYYNPDDPRLFVPRRWRGAGPVMLNFARRAAWVVAAITLVIIIILIPLVKR
jgi:uncharacterized membrane protein